MNKIKNKILNCKILDKIIAFWILIVFFTYTLFTFQWHNYEFYYWFSIVAVFFIVIYAIIHHTFLFIHNIPVNLVYLSILLTIIPAYMCKDLPEEYFFNAHHMPFSLLLPYIIIAYTEYKIKTNSNVYKNYTILDVIKAGLRLTCLTQIIWIAIQCVCIYVYNFNLNEYVFLQVLKRKYLVYMYYTLPNEKIVRLAPSGLTAHSSLLAPMFCLALLLFDNIIVQIIILLEACVCRSSTSMVGAFITFGLIILFNFITGKYSINNIKNSIKNSKWYTRIIAVVVLVLGIILCVKYGLLNRMILELSYLKTRIFNLFNNSNNKQEIHFRYFKYGLTEWKKSSILRKLIGYGYNASGYPMEQYNYLLQKYQGSSVECDYINILLSRGIIGLITFYGMLVYTAIKSLKVDYKGFIFIIATLIMGIGYNIQWEYTMVVEFLILVLCRYNKSLFSKIHSN